MEKSLQELFISRTTTIYKNAQRTEKADITVRNLITAKLLSRKLAKIWAFVSSTLFLNIKTRNCSSTANCWTKILAILRGKFGIFRGNSKFVFIHYTISRKPPNGLLWKPSLERLDWGKLRNFSARITCDLAETHERGSYKVNVRNAKIQGKGTAVHVGIAPSPSLLATYYIMRPLIRRHYLP